MVDYQLEMKIELEKEKKRVYHKEYQTKNKKRLNQISRDYYNKHKNTNIKEYRQRKKEAIYYYMKEYGKSYRADEENKEKMKVYIRGYMRDYKKRNKVKVNARNYARIYQRKDFCERCGSKDNLHFHHTDYKNRKGETLCKECHKEKHIFRRAKS